MNKFLFISLRLYFAEQWWFVQQRLATICSDISVFEGNRCNTGKEGFQDGQWLPIRYEGLLERTVLINEEKE